MEIDKIIVKEKFFKHNRWYVRVSPPQNGSSMMPYGNYVWLKGNPAFEGIPKGYVIHHLDGDPLNDDITNLVIMQKHHHAAHHWKEKIIKPEVKINVKMEWDSRDFYWPTKEPLVRECRKGRFQIRFNEKINGKTKKRYIGSWGGKVFSTQEMAEKVKGLIWENDSQ